MSGQSTDHFRDMQNALKDAGLFRPTLVIDRDRLDANIATVKAGLNPKLALRLVDKSLPVADLLTRLTDAFATSHFMTFHLPITQRMLALFPDGQFLFGKPMPGEALARALDTAGTDIARGLSERAVHLVDSPERLAAYRILADQRSIDLTIAFEVNIGMNRGGIADPDDLTHCLSGLAGQSRITLAGIMGYEAHIPAIPALFGGPGGAKSASDARFAAFVARLRPEQRAILNTGGSKTALSYGDRQPANEVSMGSAFLKPTDFDTPSLDALKPALFIATPVLKTGPATLPGLPGFSRVLQAIGLFPKQGVFLYGGHYMAKPVWPGTMAENKLWGLSSNQQFMAVGAGDTVRPGDFAFFRPTQSEAVLQQFGDIAVYSAKRIETMWTPFPTG